jgi:nucleoid DNA-binding protein
MAISARRGHDELALRIQAALGLATRKEAEKLLRIFVTCLEDTLVEHLPEDGFYLKLHGLGKLIIRHSPARRKRIGFSGEIRDVPMKRKVKFTGLGKLRQFE